MSDPNYFALWETCLKPGCPVCRLVQDSLEHFVDGVFHEMVNNTGADWQLSRTLRFCKDHIRLLFDAHLRDPHELTILYHDMLVKILSDLVLASLPKPETGVSSIHPGRLPKNLARQVESSHQALSPNERCPACRQQEQHTHVVIQSLLENLQDETFYQALVASSGLCLPHLRQALESIQSEDQFNRLVTASLPKLRALRDEMAEFICKQDYSSDKEGVGEGEDAVKLVLEKFIGTE
jgi:Family of unknown function (DUF6062)